ncbi:hypothetical protein OJ996_11055 [Luteolibacter sp. GHJ8]|uniref:Uncharacterized protein n=1 Tax=Luteolibacter rhizosphaerae TaxID=2989719 RepID=A0ABT3G384_9BACT|nr:hypothetical protein [Luteolibacter rhizosphaerae]MCW1914117.1 hypothetical protein [Luteolibacter rhizosphaerae]
MKSLIFILFALLALCHVTHAQKLKWTAEIATDSDFASPVFYSDGVGGGVVRGTTSGSAVYYWFSNKGILKGSVVASLANDQGSPLMISPTRFYIMTKLAPFNIYSLRRYTAKKGGELDANLTTLSSERALSLMEGTQEKCNDKTGFAVAFTGTSTLYVERYSH